MRPRTRIILDLDALTRRKLYAKEGGRCWICGAEASDVAHIFGRSNLGVRWDTAEDGNCHLLCRSCHSADHAGKLVPSYRDHFVARFGVDRLQELHAKANKVCYMQNGELIDRLVAEERA